VKAKNPLGGGPPWEERKISMRGQKAKEQCRNRHRRKGHGRWKKRKAVFRSKKISENGIGIPGPILSRRLSSTRKTEKSKGARA